MIHDYHQGPDDAVLYDGCAECDKRAADPIEGLLHLDRGNADRLWRRMIGVEFGEGGDGNYRSDNEARVGKHLYLFAVFDERNGHAVDVWDPDRFAV